ncbi:hypothetical protein HJG60_009057 [Phyllostomus discolor]|uniref:Uncharacterized protein n=1 Tax=Phyllostomus discolor TaxID=89673 RepID=A0A833YPR5_9CHIR|nr:hypothetical protein HJG60_009057 [Phyllostomus discolor]
MSTGPRAPVSCCCCQVRGLLEVDAEGERKGSKRGWSWEIGCGWRGHYMLGQDPPTPVQAEPTAGSTKTWEENKTLNTGRRVKAHRKQTARGRKVTNEDPVRGMVTWVSDHSQQNPQPDRPPDQLSPMEDASPSGEEQDTQYANFTFHGRKLCEAQDKEATSTCMYSEIKKTSQ